MSLNCAWSGAFAMMSWICASRDATCRVIVSDEILAFGKRSFEAPELGARFRGAVRDLGKMRIGLDAAAFGTFEFAAFRRFLIHGLEFGLLDGREIGFEVNQSFLGFTDETGFTHEIAVELLGAGLKLAGAFGRTICLAIEIFLLDLEPGERRGLRRFRLAKRRQSFGEPQFLVESSGFAIPSPSRDASSRPSAAPLPAQHFAARLAMRGASQALRSDGFRSKSPCSGALGAPGA